MAPALAKSVDIMLGRQDEPHDLMRSTAPNTSFLTYIEKEPTVVEYVKEHLPTKAGAVKYLYSLFPFLSWIFFYNTTWLLGDIVAGPFSGNAAAKVAWHVVLC